MRVMFRLLLLASSCLVLLHGKTIFPWNLTTTSTTTTTTTTKTSTPSVKTTLEMTTVVLNTTITTEFTPTITTTMATSTVEYVEETSTIVNEKPFEFKSNFSRLNDSVFVSLNANSSNSFVSINNTFASSKSNLYSCEILFNEYFIHANSNIITKITINFNASLTNDFALELGDRLQDMADLLMAIQAIENSNRTIETD